MSRPPNAPRRRSIRLRKYDYADMGAYFVTLNAFRRARLFGTAADGSVALSPAGAIVTACWRQIPDAHPHVTLDAFVVMPDHFHGILILGPEAEPRPPRVDAVPRRKRRHGIPEIVRGFKSFSAVAINRERQTPGARVWHRNYYERIVRDGAALDAMRRYIEQNPARWRG
jgi:REP element-mobilizing transposase RayT